MNKWIWIGLFLLTTLPAIAQAKTIREQVREDDGPQRLTRRLGEQLADEFIKPNLPPRLIAGNEITIDIFTPAEMSVLRDEIERLKNLNKEQDDKLRQTNDAREAAFRERDKVKQDLANVPQTRLIWIVLTFTLAPFAVAITILVYRERWQKLKEEYRNRLEEVRGRERLAEMARKALMSAQAGLIRSKTGVLAALRELIKKHPEDARDIFEKHNIPLTLLEEPPPVRVINSGRRNTGQG